MEIGEPQRIHEIEPLKEPISVPPEPEYDPDFEPIETPEEEPVHVHACLTGAV